MGVPLTADDIIRQIYDLEYVIEWETVRKSFGIHRSRKIGSGFRFKGILPEYVWPKGRINERVSEVLDDDFITAFYTTGQISVFILDDLSGSMDFGVTPLKRERAALIDAAIAYSAYIVPKDEVTYIGFSDFVEPSMCFSGREFGSDLAWRIADARLKFSGSQKSARGFSEALGYLPQNEPSLCFIISDFWPQETFLPHIIAAADMHDIVPIVIRDLWEETLPEGSGYVSLVDSESGDEVLVPLGSREKLREVLRAENERLRAGFLNAGIEAVWCTPAGNDIRRVSELFQRRLQF